VGVESAEGDHLGLRDKGQEVEADPWRSEAPDYAPWPPGPPVEAGCVDGLGQVEADTCHHEKRDKEAEGPVHGEVSSRRGEHGWVVVNRPRPDSNRGWRICNPLP